MTEGKGRNEGGSQGLVGGGAKTEGDQDSGRGLEDGQTCRMKGQGSRRLAEQADVRGRWRKADRALTEGRGVGQVVEGYVKGKGQ